MHTKQPDERDCPICGTVFTLTKPNRKFCSNTCRSAKERLQKKQKIADLASQVEHKNAQLATQKERVILVAKDSNAHWRAADLLCEAQKGRCRRIERALEENQEATRELTQPGENYKRGWVIGVFIGMILVSLLLKVCRRWKWRADVTFWLISLGIVWLIGWKAAQQGQAVDDDRRSPAQKEALQAELEELQQAKNVLRTALKQAKIRLNELEEGRDELDEFAVDLPATPSQDKEPLTPPDPA